MAYIFLPPTLEEILVSHGLSVVAVPDWERRGRPHTVGSFSPSGVLIHHTAGPAKGNLPSLDTLVDGRPDLPGPLAQLGIARDGTVYLLAAGRANHAGKAKASGPMPAGDGNSLYVGIECENTGRGEPWPDAQVDAMVRTSAALCRLMRVGADHVRGHKETSLEGKIDPAGIDMSDFRQRVAKVLATPSAPIAPKGGLDVDENTLRKIIRDETLGAKFREFTDQDGNGKRDVRSVSEILYATHSAVVDLARRMARIEEEITRR